jgi:hypothetical protein
LRSADPEIGALIREQPSTSASEISFPEALLPTAAPAIAASKNATKKYGRIDIR